MPCNQVEEGLPATIDPLLGTVPAAKSDASQKMIKVRQVPDAQVALSVLVFLEALKTAVDS